MTRSKPIPNDLTEHLWEDIKACDFVIGLAQTNEIRTLIRQMLLPILRKWMIQEWLIRIKNSLKTKIIFETFRTEGLEEYFSLFSNGFYQMAGMPGGPQRVLHTVIFFPVGDIQKNMMQNKPMPIICELEDVTINKFLKQKVFLKVLGQPVLI